MYALGEVYDWRVDYVARYQGPLNAVFSYPLFFTLRNVFAFGQSMNQIQDMLEAYRAHFSDLSVLGTLHLARELSALDTLSLSLI